MPPFAQPYSCSRKSAARGNPSLSQGQPHMCWSTLFFFPLTGPRLGRLCLLCYSFPNPGLNKSSSTGLVTLLSSAAGWWCSLPHMGTVLVRAAPGRRMPGKLFPLSLPTGRAAAPCFTPPWETTPQETGKISLSRKAVDPASTGGTFQRQLWGRKSDSLLIVIIVTAAAATTTDCIHHSLH